MAKPPRYNSRQLTDHLRELAADAETIVVGGEDEGRVITKGEALARLLFEKALGYVEMVPDPKNGKMPIEIVHSPEHWAIQLIWERLEGRAPQAITDEKPSLTATERVTELARLRFNHKAEAVAAVPGHSAPVDGPGDGVEGPEGPGPEPPVAG